MGVFNVGGTLCKCVVHIGSNPHLFGETFCGPAYFITRADDLLRVRMISYACGYFITDISDTDMT